MANVMLDTNVCIRAMRKGGRDVGIWLMANADRLCLSTVVVHELYVGAELSDRPAHQLALVETLLEKLTVLDFDSAAARHAANIRADLKQRGALIGANDILIAGHARSLGLKLITSDIADFRRVIDLRCEDWLAEGQTP